MKPESRQILAECLKRQNAIAAAEPPPQWRWWDVQARDEQLRFGPAYAVTAWFGDVEEHIRVRLRRAIASLERGDLLVVHRKHGLRLSNVRLTEAGIALAESLLPQSDAENPK